MLLWFINVWSSEADMVAIFVDNWAHVNLIKKQNDRLTSSRFEVLTDKQRKKVENVDKEEQENSIDQKTIIDLFFLVILYFFYLWQKFRCNDEKRKRNFEFSVEKRRRTHFRDEMFRRENRSTRLNTNSSEFCWHIEQKMSCALVKQRRRDASNLRHFLIRQRLLNFASIDVSNQRDQNDIAHFHKWSIIED